MIKTAVILAAGSGSRLGERTKKQPKGLLTFEEKPMIELSIVKLMEAGIDRIVIGTGYLSEAYDRLAENYPQVTCIRNPEYQTTGSLDTLYKLKDVITGDFLLLESDLIYEKNALDLLITHKKQDVILASDLTSSNDEVFIETDEFHQLVNMTKNRAELSTVYAELVGITKLSYPTFQAMCQYAKESLGVHPNLDYEHALVGISKAIKLFVHKLGKLTWCEIDDENHWIRAKRYIYPTIKAKEKAVLPIKRNILLNPGPSTTTDTVKYAQVVPDICPREKEFGDVMQFIATELTTMVGNPEHYTTILFGGSGTAAVEAILSSVIGEEAVLIVNNGAYGKRMCEIAQVYGLKLIEYQSKSDEALDLSDLESLIQNSPQKISHLAIVHNETTTGLLNDIKSVGDLCKKYQIQMIVDAMSSFAAIPIDMKTMNISYLAASSNKNLQGMAGVGFVIANKEHLEATKYRKPRNFYLHLYGQYHYFIENNQMRFTPPVQTLFALKQAIIETQLEGIQKRYQRYSKSWETLTSGLRRLGLNHLVKKEHHSRIITAIVEPQTPSYDFEEMHDYFDRHGYTIYPGKLHGQNTFRVANIGDITHQDMESFINLLELYLLRIGFCTARSETKDISET